MALAAIGGSSGRGNISGTYGKYKTETPDKVDANIKDITAKYTDIYNNANNNPNAFNDAYNLVTRYQKYFRENGDYASLSALNDKVTSQLAWWGAISASGNWDTPDNVTNEQLQGGAQEIYGKLAGQDDNVISQIMGQ